jgi:hypothetical protein
MHSSVKAAVAGSLPAVLEKRSRTAALQVGDGSRSTQGRHSRPWTRRPKADSGIVDPQRLTTEVTGRVCGRRRTAAGGRPLDAVRLTDRLGVGATLPHADNRPANQAEHQNER